MKYPDEILPNPNYKLITCDLSNYYLIRYTNSNRKEDIYDEELKQVKLTQICDPSSNINDLSTSLLGVFETTYIKIALTTLGIQNYSHYCEPDTVVEIPIFNSDFTIKDSRGYWIVLIGDINKLIADYTRGENNMKFKAECVIMHTPMKWNYWHFSIRWYTDELGYWHQLEDKIKTKLSKRLAHEARSSIAKFAKIDEPNYTQLDEVEFYK